MVCRFKYNPVLDHWVMLALWSVLGQDSLFHIASVYPAANWVPSIKKAVLRACALYAASCSGISLGGIEMVSVCTGLLGEEGRVNGGYKTINRIPLPFRSGQQGDDDNNDDEKEEDQETGKEGLGKRE